MASPQSLNDIGPGIMIESRSGSWSVRFRLRKDLKRRVRVLSRGSRSDEPFVLWASTSSAKTVNKVRALVRRIYDLGIRHRMFRDY